MKTLIISETFPPILRASARIMQDLATAFVSNGHTVSVVTFIENHEAYRHITTGKMEEDGYDVIRIRIPKQRGVGYLRRGITEELIPYIATRESLKYLKDEKFDLIVVHAPPISLFRMIKKLKKINGCPVYLVLRDINPQTGVDLGAYKKGGLLYRHFRSIEKKLYNICDIVAPQSPANRDFILKHNPQLDPKKVAVLYNWKTPTEIPPAEINFRDRFGLHGKIVCLYGGNMTSSQDLRELLVTAELCSDLDNTIFLVIGFGKERKMLEQQAQQRGLTNLLFEDPLPLNQFNILVSQCDIGLTYLNKNFTTHNFPGKLLYYMNASLPIVASVNEGNDMKQMIEDDAQCGFVHYGDNLERVAESIKMLAEDEGKRITLGKNGRRYLEEELSAQKAYEELTPQPPLFAK